MSGAKVNLRSGNVLRYYHCRGILKSEGKICDHNTYYPIDVLHQVVGEGLRHLQADPAAVSAALGRGIAAAPAPAGPDWAAERGRLDAEWERWKGALRAGAITPEELAVERRRIDAARDALPTSTAVPAKPDPAAWLARVQEVLDGLPLHERCARPGLLCRSPQVEPLHC